MECSNGGLFQAPHWGWGDNSKEMRGWVHLKMGVWTPSACYVMS